MSTTSANGATLQERTAGPAKNNGSIMPSTQREANSSSSSARRAAARRKRKKSQRAAFLVLLVGAVTGGRFLACGACLKLRESDGSEICPLSTLKDQYEIVRDSDKLITV